MDLILTLFDVPPRYTIISALIAAAAAIGVAVIAKFVFGPKLKIVDITIDDQSAAMLSTLTGEALQEFKLPLLHLFLQNSGGLAALASRAEIRVNAVWGLNLQRPEGHMMKASSTYSVELDPDRNPPYTIEFNMSQRIPSKGEDTVDVSLGLNPGSGFEALYHISLTLVYGSRRTNSCDCVVVLPDRSADPDSLMYFRDAYDRRVKELEKQAGVHSTATNVADYRRQIAEMRRKWNDEDRSPEGLASILADVLRIHEFNCRQLKLAADACSRRSSRASALIEQALAWTKRDSESREEPLV